MTLQTPESEALAPPTRSSYHDKPYSWFRLTVCMVIATVGSVGMWSIIVVLPLIEAEFGADRAAASLPFTTIMIGFGLGNIIVGRLVDRLGIFIPMIVSILLLTSGFYLTTLVSNIWQFAILQGVFIGLGTGACFGPLMSDISHWFNKRLGIAIAAAASGNYFAGMLWPLILKNILETEGWRSAQITIAITIFCVMFPLAFLLRKKRPEDEVELPSSAAPAPTSRKTANLSTSTLQFLMIVAGVSCCVAMSMPQVHIVAYCADLGYGIARGAEMLSLMLGGGIISRLLSGVLADYIGGVRTLLLGSILQCIALFLYMPFDGLVSLYVVSLVFGLSQGGIVPSYAIIVREYLPAKEAGQRVGLIVFSTVVGMAFGGWLSGLIYDLTQSYDAAFINGIAWNLLNIACMTFILMRSKPRRSASVAT
ncbi:MFS transporter [Sneathiella glossodoripedis]|uniref:MFS transporter n=1 Tax=Sneathiella glossodoripedis TaxID=418853 RepID=UPI0004720670|nr:MFS transporter [Sneathiella glossodoripedis]